MVNNIGTLINNKSLNTNLGEATSNIVRADVNMLTGTFGLGTLVFDPTGTLAVISDYTSDNNFTIRTYALSIDIATILGGSY